MKREIDMLQGSLWDKILLFAMPLAASSMLQQLFNSADMAVVGRFAGKEALAAVGSNSSLVSLMINIFVGLSIGTSVLVARYVGSGEKKKISAAVHTSVAVAVISGVILIFIGMGCSRFMLELMATPPDVIDLASVYLKIYFAGMPFFMVYNFGAAILRSVGDTRRPLVILCITGIVNVLLNLFFVIQCNLSVVGVGLATLIANFLSALLVLRILMKETGDLKLELKNISIDRKILADILKIGIPAGVQGLVFSISNVIIQTYVNGFGSTVISGSAAAINYEYMAWFLLGGFTQAATTFTSQNYGAGQISRCRKAIVLSAVMGTALSVVFDIVCVVYDEFFLGIFTSDPAVIECGALRFRYILMIQGIACIYEIVSGGLRGLGYSMSPAVISIIGVCVFRIFWVYVVFPQMPTFEMLLTVYPVSWVITDIGTVSACWIALRRVSRKFGNGGGEPGTVLSV